MTQSFRFDISSALWAALESAPRLAGARLVRNPRHPATLKDGTRVVFLEDQSDGFVDGKGQQGMRRYTFGLGVINRSEEPEAPADADQVAAEAALRSCANGLSRENEVGQIRETQTTFKVEGVDVGGALVLTTFELEYRRPRPART